MTVKLIRFDAADYLFEVKWDGVRGIAYLAYSPLAAPSGASLRAARTVAGRHHASVQRVMLAWLRAQAPAIVPPVGASRPASIRDSANLIELTRQDLAELTPVSANRPHLP